MNTNLLAASGLVFALFVLWVVVQALARRYSERHPEFGEHREEGGECGVSCGCANRRSCATFPKMPATSGDSADPARSSSTNSEP